MGQHVEVGGLDIGVSKTNISKSPVIHKDKDNVWLGGGRGSRAVHYQREGQGQQDNTRHPWNCKWGVANCIHMITWPDLTSNIHALCVVTA